MPANYRKCTCAMYLDPRLASNSTFIAELKLCQLRLHHNAAFPWFLLIPQREAISEVIDLTPAEQQVLIKEISLTSQAVGHIFQPKKLNIASLGNIISQLHVHIIARYENDGAWPNPVWNSNINQHYKEDLKEKRIVDMQGALSESIGFDGLLNEEKPSDLLPLLVNPG